MKTQSLNDERLIKACSKGSTEAFGSLVKKYQSYICAITFGATGNIHHSEEIAQDVFILAWQNLSQLKDSTKFKSWIYIITKNQIKKFYRSQQNDLIARAGTLENATPVKDVENLPPQAAISNEQQSLVRDTLNHIPAHYREPLILFYREGKSIRQVAHFFDISEATAKKRISRARQMIKSRLLSTLEQTLETTRPNHAFSTSVISLIAVGTLSKSTATAGTIQTGTHIVTTFIQSTSAKITAAAAVIAIGVGTTMYTAANQNSVPERPIARTLSPELMNGLVMYLSFDRVEETEGQTVLADESYRGNNGTLTGGKFVKGRIGQALKCSAKNQTDGVIVKDNNSLDLDTVTIAAWVKTENKDNQWNRILDKGWDTAYNLCIGGDAVNGKPWRDRGTLECRKTSLISKTSIVDNQWHFLTGTYDGQTLKLYIDGALDTKKKCLVPKRMIHNNIDIRIGAIAVPEPPPYGRPFFEGLIDEVRLYNRVLTAQEIHDLYCYQPYD